MIETTWPEQVPGVANAISYEIVNNMPNYLFVTTRAGNCIGTGKPVAVDGAS